MSDAPAFALIACNCPTHGRYEAYRADRAPLELNDCPRCIDAGSGVETARLSAQDWRAKRLAALREHCGIPPRFADASLDGYHATAPGQKFALMVAKAYAASWPDQVRKGGSLLLNGKCGTGKTHLGCGIANAVMGEHMATARFGNFSTLTRAVRSTYGGKSKRTESQVMDSMFRPDLLVLDEVGAQGGSDHELHLLFEVINSRYLDLRPTIVISNLTSEDLEKFIGQRTMDRLREATTVAFDWQSHRGQSRASA